MGLQNATSVRIVAERPSKYRPHVWRIGSKRDGDRCRRRNILKKSLFGLHYGQWESLAHISSKLKAQSGRITTAITNDIFVPELEVVAVEVNVKTKTN